MERLPNVDKLQEEEMSRTYRRRKNKQGSGESGFWTRCSDPVIENWWIDYKYGGNAKKAEAKYHADSDSGYYSPPSWFYREYYTKPERTKTRKALYEVMRLVDYEETPLFPLDRKPKEYWW